MLGKIEVPVAEDVAVAVLVMEAVVDGRISTGCPPRVLGSLMMAAANSEVPSSCVTGIIMMGIIMIGASRQKRCHKGAAPPCRLHHCSTQSGDTQPWLCQQPTGS
jgi:hypothetical protein